MTQDEDKTESQSITELDRTRKESAKVETVAGLLESKENIFRLLTENSVTGMFIFQDEKMAYVNPGLARMLGYEPNEMVGKLTIRDVVHPDCLPIAMQRMQQQLDGNIVERNVSYKAMKKDGSLMYVEVYGVPTEFQGRPAVMGTVIDVTERKKAKDALQDSERKFRSITENAADYIFIKDRTRRYTFVNKAMIELLGLPENAIVGKTPEEVFGPEEGEAMRRVDDITFSGETVNKTRDLLIGGSQRSFNTVQTPLTVAEGKVTSIMGIVRDVTERKRAEEVLRRSEQQFRTLFQGVVQPIIIYERDTTILMINPAGARNLNRSPDECLGKTLKELLPAIHDVASERFAEVIDTGKQLLVEDRVELSTGTKWFWTILQPVCDEEGKAYAVMNISYDVTERKRIEAQVLAEKKFTDTALDAQMDTFFLFEPSTGKALRWNRIFSEMSGYTDEEIADMPAPASYYNQEDVKRAESFIQDVLREGSGTIELELICKDGRKVPTEYRASVVNDEQGEPKYVISIGRDVTQRKKMEEQLHQSERMEAVGQLAGGIAHDFNNQLGAILGFADMLRRKVAWNDESVEYCDNIIRGVERAADLTSKLLAFSRKGNYVRTPVDVHRLIVEVTEVLRRTVDKRVRIRQHLDARIPNVFGDASQLQNALLNLGLNARDAMPEGGELILSTKNILLGETKRENVSQELPPGEYIRITVRDTGTGIARENLKYIFEPFFTTKESGTGMGLAAVHGTVTSHGGAIEVQSTPDVGTTVAIYLSAREDVVAADEPPNEQMVAPGEGNILLVDDEHLIRAVVSDMLESLGYNVQVCGDGIEAVERFCSAPEAFDLVILDMVMPGLSGKEVFDRMKFSRPDIKVLVSSGYSAESEAQSIVDAGTNGVAAKGFIQKPFSRESLARKVAEILKKSVDNEAK